MALLGLALLTSTAAAGGPSPVLLRTADSFGVLGGSTITNTGNTVINGDLGLHPGTAVTGFPPGQVNGAMHVTDAVAQQAKTDLVTAYDDAAGRPMTATLPPDAGGSILPAGVYRTGGVPTLGLTGNLTLDAQGDPSSVFIFQIASQLTTATDSSVSLVNGAQACNVFWQVGSSATLGTRTAFKGNILALTSISADDAVRVEGRLLARNGAVTLINDTITRSQCATTAVTPGIGGTAPETAPSAVPTSPAGSPPSPVTVPGAGQGPGRTPGNVPSRDSTPPVVEIGGLPGIHHGASFRGSGTPNRTSTRDVCTTRNFTALVRVRDRGRIRSVQVYIDGGRVKETFLRRFSLRVNIRGLRIGTHRITVVARDRAGNRASVTRRFGRCKVKLAVPRFTG